MSEEKEEKDYLPTDKDFARAILDIAIDRIRKGNSSFPGVGEKIIEDWEKEFEKKWDKK